MKNFNQKNNVEILCIGTELLLGNIINSNARWIAEELSTLGLDHYQQTVIGDNSSRLSKAILDASHRCRLLITTGGLGPTPDDLTTETIATSFKSSLHERKEVWEDIKRKLIDSSKKPSENNRKQAFLPKDAILIPNPTGTAPGMIWSPKDNFTILTFPGVPSELKEMWKSTASNWLKENINNHQTYTSKTLKLIGISESKIAEEINDLIYNQNPTIAPYASLGEVKLRITSKAKNVFEGESLIEPIEKEIYNRFGQKCYGVNEDTISSILINILKEKKETLSVAESCTGGLLGAKLTSIPGASKVFLGGVIAYQNSVKENILGIPKFLLEKHGAVSSEVVESMAKAVRKQFKSDWSIAISGIAGPEGGSKSKPVGLVYIGIAGPNGVESLPKLFSTFKGRHNIQNLSVINSLNRLRLLLLSRS